jgi:chemotaxis protein MotB
MRRRKKHTTHANHERWIVSYADFVTLLFAFFVVLFATANADRGKAGVVAAAVRAALNETKVGGGSGSTTHSAAFEQKQDQNSAEVTRTAMELLPSMQLLERELKPEIQRGTVELQMEARGLTISFKQAAFFDSGSDQVKPEAVVTIAKVGAALLKIPNQVRLEGHTDNIPISSSRFSNNWVLSSSRAIAVLEVLTGEFQVPRSRLAVGGYADVVPVASNDSEEGRARNRRVDVVILSQYGVAGEPDTRR